MKENETLANIKRERQIGFISSRSLFLARAQMVYHYFSQFHDLNELFSEHNHAMLIYEGFYPQSHFLTTNYNCLIHAFSFLLNRSF